MSDQRHEQIVKSFYGFLAGLLCGGGAGWVAVAYDLEPIVVLIPGIMLYIFVAKLIFKV